MQKKHVMELKVNGQIVTIGTDDLEDLMAQSWIQKSLGIDNRELQENAIVNARKYRDIALEFQEEVQLLRAEVDKYKRKAEVGSSVVVEETRQPSGGERILPPEPPVQKPVLPAGRPQMASQRLPQKSSLDITPAEMTEAVWVSMQPAEQEQWRKNYNV